MVRLLGLFVQVINNLRISFNLRFSCPSCDKKYTCQKSLQRHVAVDHNGQQRSDKKLHKKKDRACGSYRYAQRLYMHSVFEVNLKSFFRCNACNETFSMREPYMQHMRRHAEPAQNVSSPKKLNRSAGFLCLKCDLAFPDDVSFRAHARAHSELVPPGVSQVSVPPSPRPSKNSKNKHDPPASCPICNQYLSRQSHMKRHMFNVHKIVHEPTEQSSSSISTGA